MLSDLVLLGARGWTSAEAQGVVGTLIASVTCAVVILLLTSAAADCYDPARKEYEGPRSPRAAVWCWFLGLLFLTVPGIFAAVSAGLLLRELAFLLYELLVSYVEIWHTHV